MGTLFGVHGVEEFCCAEATECGGMRLEVPGVTPWGGHAWGWSTQNKEGESEEDTDLDKLVQQFDFSATWGNEWFHFLNFFSM